MRLDKSEEQGVSVSESLVVDHEFLSKVWDPYVEVRDPVAMEERSTPSEQSAVGEFGSDERQLLDALSAGDVDEVQLDVKLSEVPKPDSDQDVGRGDPWLFSDLVAYEDVHGAAESVRPVVDEVWPKPWSVEEGELLPKAYPFELQGVVWVGVVNAVDMVVCPEDVS